MTEADGTTATEAVSAAASATASRPETAWPLENVLFSTALVAQRLPWADLPARALGVEALTLDGLTRRLMTHLRAGRPGRPVRLRTPFGAFVVPLTRAAAETLLTCADGAGALGTATRLAADGSRYALSPHVAPPDAWDAAAQHGLDGPAGQVAEHLVRLPAARREDGTLDRDLWRHGMLRLSRLVVLGAGAADDTLLSELVTAAGASGGRAYEARAAALRRRLAPYVAAAEPGSLAGRLASGRRDAEETYPAVAHALALVSTATTVSALDALAPSGAAAAEEAVESALDRHPPLSAVVYPVRVPVAAHGTALGAGDEILYLPQLLGPRADGERTDPSWSLCGSPSGCAAARFAALVCGEVVRGVAAHGAPWAGDPAAAGRLSGHGMRAQAAADRLDGHAQTLSACATDPGWNGSEAGERFRMVLLAHADRCSRAATDVRRAARRLSD